MSEPRVRPKEGRTWGTTAPGVFAEGRVQGADARTTAEERYNHAMADRVIHISEEEAARDFASLMDRVRAGAEVVIESGGAKLPVAVLRSAEPSVRLLSESLRLAKEHASPATLDGNFARDL